MFRFYVVLVTGLMVALLVAHTGAMALGHLQPPNPLLTGFYEACRDASQPCWYGIRPGITSASDAQDQLGYHKLRFSTTLHPALVRLEMDAFSPRCRVSVDYRLEISNLVYIVRLWNCQDLRLADLMTVFGAPDHFRACPESYLKPSLLYAAGMVIELPNNITRLSPDQRISEFRLYPPRWVGHYQTPWLGFGRVWRYHAVTDPADCT